MKRAIAALIFALASAVALALPSPRDIEAAVKAGQLSQAETMLHEVVKEKPGSAKAHYELGQVLAREGRYEAARKELLEARRLDPSLKFATDPQRFHDLLNKIPAATPAPALKPAEATAHGAPALPAESSFPWMYVVLGGGVLVAVVLFLRRASPLAGAPLGAASRGGVAATGYAPGSGSYGPAAYGPGAGVPPQNAGSGSGSGSGPGSGLGGAVLGGLAGMAAGYGLAKVLEHGDETPAARHAAPAADNGYVPIDSGAAPDFGNFDAGAGDSWDDGGSSSSDDNW